MTWTTRRVCEKITQKTDGQCLARFQTQDSHKISSEADIRKDERRHVKVLCADYCGLRDELLRLLTADWAPTARENHED